MVLAGLLGVIAGVLLTIVVEATVLPGLFDRVHDFFSRETATPTTAPLPELNEEAKRQREAAREMEEMARQKQQELEQDLKKNQEEVEGNR